MNPPPPPPHGEGVPKQSGLPPGNYDIFIIPPHSSGSGFLYLPSLKPSVNSFAAGFASALILVVVGSALAPVVQAWWAGVKGSGGTGMIMIMLAIGVGAWALGRAQNDGGAGPGDRGNPSPGGSPHGASEGATHGASHGAPPPNPHASGSGPDPGPGTGTGSRMPGGGGEKPKPTWGRTNTGPGAGAGYGAGGGAGAGAGAGTSNPNGARSGWEKAREETKRKEEERKAREAEKKAREEAERKLKEAREKEMREREARERMEREREKERVREREKQKERERERELEKQREMEALRKQLEKEALEKLREKEALKKEIEKEFLERQQKEEALKKQQEKEAQEKEEKARKEAQKEAPKEEPKVKSTYAFSSVGERTNPWPKGHPTISPIRPPPSPTKKPPAPTAKTYLETEEDRHSFRPYDKLKKPVRKKSLSSVYSESSYAASYTTGATTPPPSHRSPYSTKDPDKIVIKAVYAFTNAFLKTPTSQLVSGVGSVTDGLILRITTEGLFIDDDVRGVPQREWDIKAWTMKLVEVWCPNFRNGASASTSTQSASAPRSAAHPNPVRRLWNFEKDKAATNEEADALLIDMLQTCKDSCRSASLASTPASASSLHNKNSNKFRKHQTGELKSARLHVLRASIRDQEGKRYVFVLTEEESWKVAVGLQRLRRGTQVRALGVSTMSAADARSTLENLGWR